MQEEGAMRSRWVWSVLLHARISYDSYKLTCMYVCMYIYYEHNQKHNL